MKFESFLLQIPLSGSCSNTMLTWHVKFKKTRKEGCENLKGTGNNIHTKVGNKHYHVVGKLCSGKDKEGPPSITHSLCLHPHSDKSPPNLLASFASILDEFGFSIAIRGKNWPAPLMDKCPPKPVCPSVLSLIGNTTDPDMLPVFEFSKKLSLLENATLAEAFQHADAAANAKGKKCSIALEYERESNRPSIQFCEFKLLQGVKWLNDSLINLCFWTFQQRDMRFSRTRGSKNNYFFQTHFF